MKKIIVSLIVLGCILVSGCKERKKNGNNDQMIAIGKMPAVSKDHEDNFHMVYGCGDSILYSTSNDKGETFSSPVLIDVLAELQPPTCAVPRLHAPQAV